jgi:hypothetical protein
MLQIYRGVYPVVLAPEEEAAVATDPSGVRSHELEVDRAVALGFCKPGDTVIIVASEKAKANSVMGHAIAMRVVQVQRIDL